MKILSIDQAATLSGYSYWEDNKPVKWGIVQPSPKNLKDGHRLTSLRRQFLALFDTFHPDIILIEDPVGGQEDKVGGENNWKTMQVLCQVQGMLLQLIHEKGYKCDIVSPSSWQNSCEIFKRERAARKAGATAFVKKKYDLEVSQDICDSICIAYHWLYKQNFKDEEHAAF